MEKTSVFFFLVYFLSFFFWGGGSLLISNHLIQGGGKAKVGAPIIPSGYATENGTVNNNLWENLYSRWHYKGKVKRIRKIMWLQRPTSCQICGRVVVTENNILFFRRQLRKNKFLFLQRCSFSYAKIKINNKRCRRKQIELLLIQFCLKTRNLR